MKKTVRWTTFGLLLGLLIVSVASAQPQEFEVSWWSINNGGGTASGGDYSLYGVIAQIEAGTLSSEEFSLQGGFLSGIDTVYRLYLPLSLTEAP